MRDTESFEYRDHRITIDIQRVPAESDTGVYMTTITIAAPGPDGKLGAPAYLCRRAQYIFLDEAAAYAAAAARARAYVDAAGAAP
ncbi:hypothetical protein AKI39_06745 [Bordetella sp. H567]|uniref:hypothetical protein n=1 Tax=Bordetella sp. H567 TaxID=1697043 RepID=UPI00081CA97B|nr:hypothetical protein [Bordetella sp. H567]AOB30458.1 hypothetical protein AKI39_06745 [Bordetella sp. H567]